MSIRRVHCKKVRVWTLQPERVWLALQQDKVLFADPTRSEGAGIWPEPYHWMIGQMQKRLPEFEGHAPWWGWHKPKPYSKRTFWKAVVQTEPMVCIELSIPVECVLLSHFPAWEMVLNGGYVGATSHDYADWEAALADHAIDNLKSPLPEPWQSRMTASWETIFDLPRLDAGGEWSSGWVQATFERLMLEDVVNVSDWITAPRRLRP